MFVDRVSDNNIYILLLFIYIYLLELEKECETIRTDE